MSAPSRRRPRAADDGGWVLVPAVATLTITLLLGLALLALVDRQTGAAAQQRVGDRAQELADGVLAATTSALADLGAEDDAVLAAAWRRDGRCATVGGTVGGAGTTAVAQDGSTAETTAAWRTVGEDVGDHMAAGLDEATPAGTRWEARLCPAGDDGVRVRAQVGPGGRRAGWRAAESTIRPSTATFTPPADLAIATGSFATDLSTPLVDTVRQGAVGRLVLGAVLGDDRGLVEDDAARIGLRCGLLDALDNPRLDLCLGGALAGVNGVVGGVADTLGLPAIGQALGGVLGVDRTRNLATYTVANDAALAALATAARASGTYAAGVAGGGAGTTASCLQGLSRTPDRDTVVYVDRVGNGDEYCAVPDGTVARAIVVAHGRIRVAGRVTGVVYAANRQETAGEGADDAAARKAAPRRETVRVEHPGTVTGAVWTDGAGGQVGLYPAVPGAGPPTTAALLAVGGPQGVCSLPVLGPVLRLVDGTLSGVLSLVGGLLEGVVGYQTQVRTVGGATTDCALLRNTLGALTASQLLTLFGTGEDRLTVPVSEQRTRSCRTWVVVCVEWNDWGAWRPRDTQAVALPSLLPSLAAPDVLAQLLSTLGGLAQPWTAVTLDRDVVARTATRYPVGADLVRGTYRTVPPAPPAATGTP